MRRLLIVAMTMVTGVALPGRSSPPPTRLPGAMSLDHTWKVRPGRRRDNGGMNPSGAADLVRARLGAAIIQRVAGPQGPWRRWPGIRTTAGTRGGGCSGLLARLADRQLQVVGEAA